MLEYYVQNPYSSINNLFQLLWFWNYYTNNMEGEEIKHNYIYVFQILYLIIVHNYAS